jgi:hypothetical protein
MFNTDDENERQAAIRRDRDFDSLDAHDRLAWANAASTPAEIAAEQAAKAAIEASYTAPQRAYLGDRKLEDLTTEIDLDNFKALGEIGKSSDDSVPEKPPAASGGPIELDPVAVAAANLSPEHRVQIVESAETLKRAAAEAGLNPAVRRHTPAEVESARRWVAPYLKK